MDDHWNWLNTIIRGTWNISLFFYCCKKREKNTSAAYRSINSRKPFRFWVRFVPSKWQSKIYDKFIPMKWDAVRYSQIRLINLWRKKKSHERNRTTDFVVYFADGWKRVQIKMVGSRFNLKCICRAVSGTINESKRKSIKSIWAFRN